MSIGPLSPGRDFRFWLLFLIGICTVLSGCGQRTGQESISGAITFEGKPLDDGTIQFFTMGESPTLVAGAKIVNGRYEVPKEHSVPPGKYLVRISSTVSVEIPPMEGSPAMSSFKVRERIPVKYNTESTLSVDIHAGGRDPIDFKLE